MLTSHLPLPTDIVEMAQYYIYDKENFLLPPGQSPLTWYCDSEECVHIYAIRHAYAIVKNMYLAAHMAKSLDYDNFLFSEYDTILSEYGVQKFPHLLDVVGKTDKKMFLFEVREDFTSSNRAYETLFFGANVDFFLKNVKLVKSYEEWNVTWPYMNASDLLETMWVRMLESHENDVHREQTNINEYFKSKFNACTNVDYDKNSVLYNREDPTHPLFFIICKGGQYELLMDDMVIYSQYCNNGEWMKVRFQLPEGGCQITLKENGNTMFSKRITKEFMESIKDISYVEKINK
jgi:hypothetical protein